MSKAGEGMEIREYQDEHLHRLYEYWRRVGSNIPFFFPVPVQRWGKCLLEDEFDGERIFKRLDTTFAEENGEILGFVQYGQPSFAWSENGQKVYTPDIGVIRHLYFEPGRNEVGGALLSIALDQLAGFERNHAFYHILGMSCNAHHGKLHSSQPHVERVLRGSGFQVEHENFYYVLELKQPELVGNPRMHLDRTFFSSGERFEVRLNAEVAGTAQVRYLEVLTDGMARDTAYLIWLGVGELHRRQGIGTELMRHIIQWLRGRGYRYLHTDTASDNHGAQAFYERLGFQRMGTTRSYVQT
jgi:ribosomal protein S18 acetylase RimI-like enzyme